MSRSLKTPLGQVRGLGSAKSGTEHFFLQRLTALSNIVVVIGGLFVVLLTVFQPYAQAARIIAHPLVSILLAGLILSIAIHMRLGMQVIIEDYIHTPLAKTLALVANTLFCAGVAIAGLVAILRIGRLYY